jgi:flagellar L-ring protein precursor FlgH
MTEIRDTSQRARTGSPIPYPLSPIPSLACAALLLVGCTGLTSPYNPPAPAPLLPPVDFARPPATYRSDGSLWTSENASLWSDPVAHTLADIIFVNVREDTTASNTADTELKRKSNVDLGIPNFLGAENEVNTINDSDPTNGVDPTHLIRANTQNDFKSEADTTRQGRLTARVSAQVVDVFPNGNLRIYGSQVVTVNNENQIITVEGIARPYDIAPDNSIDSFLLAEARIELTGRGVVSDQARPGWGARVIDWIWPF